MTEIDYVRQRRIAALERELADSEYQARVEFAVTLAASSRLGSLLAAGMLPQTADGKVMADA